MIIQKLFFIVIYITILASCASFNSATKNAKLASENYEQNDYERAGVLARYAYESGDYEIKHEMSILLGKIYFHEKKYIQALDKLSEASSSKYDYHDLDEYIYKSYFFVNEKGDIGKIKQTAIKEISRVCKQLLSSDDVSKERIITCTTYWFGSDRSYVPIDDDIKLLSFCLLSDLLTDDINNVQLWELRSSVNDHGDRVEVAIADKAIARSIEYDLSIPVLLEKNSALILAENGLYLEEFSNSSSRVVQDGYFTITVGFYKTTYGSMIKNRKYAEGRITLSSKFNLTEQFYAKAGNIYVLSPDIDEGSYPKSWSVNVNIIRPEQYRVPEDISLCH